jgi:lipopolysaccharide/colanic/teichoic acid biosynthesis glycosyltransferase
MLEVVFKSWLYILLLVIFIAYLWGDVKLISRTVFVTWAILTPLIIILAKLWLNKYWLAHSRFNVPILLVGENYEFTDFEKNRLQDQCLEILHYDPSQINELSEVIRNENIEVMVLNVKSKASGELIKTLTRLELSGVRLMSMNHFFEKYLRKCYVPYDVIGVDYLDDVSGYSLTQYLLKRVVDYMAALSLLAVSIPIMIYAIKKIKKESPGKVFFKQPRIGVKASCFDVIKFRSMHENSHFDPYTQEEDARVYSFGQFMRKTRIDELPQLWNVIKGDMHLLGPRTEWDILVESYEKTIPFYHERHLVKPGISGWAQVMYPYGTNTEDARQKLMYDLYYIKHWNIWLEAETIIRTVGVVLGKNGI